MMGVDIRKNEYFKWLTNFVYNDDPSLPPSMQYRKLLLALMNKPFYVVHELDQNRAGDGLALRYLYFEERYGDGEMAATFEEDCTILELMIALSRRIENDIMGNINCGNRTGQWFWRMIYSLGLSGQNDINFDDGYVDYVLTRFNNRQYAPNGEGGLFTVNSEYGPPMTEIEIWRQAMRYLNSLESEG